MKTKSKSVLLNVLFFPHKNERDKTKIHFKTQFRASKPANTLNGSKWQKMALDACEKVIQVLTRSDIK